MLKVTEYKNLKQLILFRWNKQKHLSAVEPLLNKRLGATILLLLSSACYANVVHQTDAQTGLQSWLMKQPGIELKILQRTPDQTRGFFIARGFSSAQASRIATSCVMQTIMKNTDSANNGKTIEISLKDWQVNYQGKKQTVKLKEQWLEEWKNNPEVKKSAQVAFRWATFPSQQNFEPGGDYNWGMISFGLAPGQYFDLLVKWKRAGKMQSYLIKKIKCSEEGK